jgi:hypothetical protein
MSRYLVVSDFKRRVFSADYGAIARWTTKFWKMFLRSPLQWNSILSELARYLNKDLDFCPWCHRSVENNQQFIGTAYGGDSSTSGTHKTIF